MSEIIASFLICRKNGEKIAELVCEHIGTGTYLHYIKYNGHNANHVISLEEYERILKEARERGYDVFDYSPVED